MEEKSYLFILHLINLLNLQLRFNSHFQLNYLQKCKPFDGFKRCKAIYINESSVQESEKIPKNKSKNKIR